MLWETKNSMFMQGFGFLIYIALSYIIPHIDMGKRSTAVRLHERNTICELLFTRFLIIMVRTIFMLITK